MTLHDIPSHYITFTHTIWYNLHLLLASSFRLQRKLASLITIRHFRGTVDHALLRTCWHWRIGFEFGHTARVGCASGRLCDIACDIASLLG